MLNISSLKKDFPIFSQDPTLVYLDSAATSLKPRPVIEAVTDYYTKYSANVHRGFYKISRKATEEFERAREAIAKFLHAKFPHEILFTNGATAALNMIAQGYSRQFLRSGNEIIVTMLEHHANIVPWQMMAKKNNLKLTFWDITNEGILKELEFNKLLNQRTKLLAITHVSNSIGTINPLKRIIQKAHAAKVKVVVDASQSVPHLPIDVQYLDCDFFAFSSHKMMGPSGVGALYVKDRILQQLDPFFFGGDMIREVYQEYSTWNDAPWKFEAGTPPIEGIIGLSAAIAYLQSIGLSNIREHEKNLLASAITALKKLPFVQLYGPLDPETQSGVLSFTVENVHPHDIAAFLDTKNIAIRVGHHCSMPLMTRLKVPATARISFYAYNTEEDIERCVAALKKVHEIFMKPSRPASARTSMPARKHALSFASSATLKPIRTKILSR